MLRVEQCLSHPVPSATCSQELSPCPRVFGLAQAMRGLQGRRVAGCPLCARHVPSGPRFPLPDVYSSAETESWWRYLWPYQPPLSLPSSKSRLP